MSHVAANFPNLKRFDFEETNVTPDGLMQLVDLHWLETIGTPRNMAGPDYDSIISTKDKEKKVG